MKLSFQTWSHLHSRQDNHTVQFTLVARAALSGDLQQTCRVEANSFVWVRAAKQGIAPLCGRERLSSLALLFHADQESTVNAVICVLNKR